MIPRAQEPFCFFTRLSLTLLTGIKAKNLQELLDYLKVAPEPVIYHHTHRFLQQYQYLVPEPPNDFAYWVAYMLQDEKLGERLAAIDTIQFNSLSELQKALVFAIEDHIKKNNVFRHSPDGKDFHFMSALRFSVPTPYLAYDHAEFLDCLKKVGISSLYLHIFEARLRPPLGINDFSNWFETQLGDKGLAKKVATLVPYMQTLEGLRSRMIGLIEKRIEELSHAAS